MSKFIQFLDCYDFTQIYQHSLERKYNNCILAREKYEAQVRLDTFMASHNVTGFGAFGIRKSRNYSPVWGW